MKWKFLGLSLIAATQGGLLTWQEWIYQQRFEQQHTIFVEDDNTTMSTTACYTTDWPPMVAMILSFLIFFYCLRQFFRLNAAVPIQRRRLKIMPRRE